jgi:peptidyl-prolyl cis-trans isomerase C
MRIRNTCLAAIVTILSVILCAAYSDAASKQFAAKVNGTGIKSASLDTAVNNFIENQKTFGVTVKDEEKDKLRADILNELISAELLYQESQKAGLGDLSKEADTQLENIKKGFGSEKEFQNVLKDRGIVIKDLKEDIKKGVYINAFLEKSVFSKMAPISEEEKKQEYETNKDKLNVPEEVRASHILIKFSDKATDEEKQKAREKIEALKSRLTAGEDFAKLAKENSEDTSAANGGDLSYFRKGDMVKPFEDAAFSLEKDQISDVVETQFGYHVLKLTDKRPARTLTYEEVANDIATFLLNKHKREEINRFVEELRKKAKIEIL